MDAQRKASRHFSKGPLEMAPMITISQNHMKRKNQQAITQLGL